jgi:hypothetical protein
MAHMQFLIAMIQRTSGVNDSMLGLGGVNERSAAQMQGRIAAGSSMQNSIIENLYFSDKQVSRLIVTFMGAYYTNERVVRITEPNGQAVFAQLNQPVQDEATGETQILNDVSDVLRFDVILKMVAPFDSVREHSLRLFAEVAKANVLPPEIIGELLINFSDIPDKHDVIRRMQQHMDAQRQAQQAAIEQQALSAGNPPTPPGA